MIKIDKELMAERLRTLRRRCGETQEETASKIGVSPSAYAMYETGTRVPRDDVKIKISKHFNEPVAEIFFLNTLLTESERKDK